MGWGGECSHIRQHRAPRPGAADAQRSLSGQAGEGEPGAGVCGGGIIPPGAPHAVCPPPIWGTLNDSGDTAGAGNGLTPQRPCRISGPPDPGTWGWFPACAPRGGLVACRDPPHSKPGPPPNTTTTTPTFPGTAIVGGPAAAVPARPQKCLAWVFWGGGVGMLKVNPPLLAPKCPPPHPDSPP